MAKERQVTVTILGQDKGASKALKGVGDAAERVGPSTKVANDALDSVTSKLTSGLGPASGQAKDALDKVGSSAISSGGMLAAGLAGGALVAGAALTKFALDGAHAFVELAGEVRNFQQASGASAEDSSRFVAVLDDLGISSDKGASAIFKLGKNVSDGGDKLKAFGIEVARNKDGTTDLTGTLLNAADAYVKTSDPAKRAELAFAAFGKQGQDLIPVLEQGREGLKKFFEGAEGGRQIFSQEDLDKARKYELAIDDLQDTFRGLKMEGGETLLPFLTGLAEAGTKTFQFLDMLKDRAPSAFESLRTSAVAAVTGPLGQLADIIGQVGGKSDTTKVSSKGLEDQTRLNAEAALEAGRANEEQARALDKVIDATVRALSSSLNYETAVNRLKDAAADLDNKEQALSVAIRDHGAASNEAEAANRTLRDAHIGIKDAALNAAGAAVKLAEDTAISNGASLTAEERARIFRDKLYELAGQAGASAGDIRALADNIRDIPNRNVTINIDKYENTYVRRYVSTMGAPYAGAMATGGHRGAGQLNFAASGLAGFKTNGPTLVGEGNQNYPEYVLATDPMYRDRNLRLLAMAANDMGLRALAAGGTINEDDPRFDWRTMGNKQRGVYIDGQGWMLQDASGRLSPHPYPPGTPKKAGMVEERPGMWVPARTAAYPVAGTAPTAPSEGGTVTIGPGAIVVYALDPKQAALDVRDELLRYQRRSPLGWEFTDAHARLGLRT